MTTVAEAKRELAEIAERQAALQKIVDAAPKSLLTKPVIGSGSCVWRINDNGGLGSKLGSKMGYAHSDSPQAYAGPNIFTNGKTAEAYADALDTLLMLRHQPGTEAARDESQFLIEAGMEKPVVITWVGISYKSSLISPCFDTEAATKAAIDTIGADRILRMFRTLHGVA